MRKAVLFFALFVTGLAFAQEDEPKKGFKEYVLEGNYLLLEENYKMAIDNYLEAYKIDSSNALLNYNMGLCYLNILTEKSKAEHHFAKAIKKVDKNCRIDDALETSAPPLAFYEYGKALHLNYKFDEELEQYNMFEKYVGTKDKEWKKLLDRQREICDYAKIMIEAPMNVQILNMGDSINSEYPEYSPVMSADESMLIYTTRRPSTTGAGKDDAGNYYEDVVVSYKTEDGRWTKPVSISPNINGFGAEASVNLSSDGQTLIIYRDAGDGNNGNLYYSTFDGIDWSPLKEFGSDVNTTYHESHACLSSDGNTLIFASDRPGGFGGSDLYRCVKLPNGNWSKALNLGSTINTEYNEDGAFIHPDGRTFFFTSNGHKTIGGYDIMFTFMDENNEFSEIYNMGYPINTTDDDIFYVTSPDGKRGYFSSVKEGGYGEKDIYQVSIPSAKEKPLVLFKGQILPSTGEKLPEDMVIIVKDKETGEIVGTYRPKSTNGTFSTILPPGREYTFSYQAPQGYEFYSEDVFVVEDMSYTEINRAISLEPVQLLGKIKAKLNALELKTVILSDKSNKKPVADAKVFIQQVNGKSRELTTDKSGATSQIMIAMDSEYKIYATSGSVKTETVTLSTKGVTPPKIFNQLIYLDAREPVKEVKSDLVLNVLVKDTKGKPLSNATVELVTKDGEKTQFSTNDKGIAENISLEKKTSYEVYAYVGDNASKKSAINTAAVKGRVVKRTFVINTASSGAVTVADNVVAEGEFQFFFKYNRNKIDEQEESWMNFIKKVVTLSKERTVIIDIYSSASMVPTRAYSNNKQLAATRAKKTQEILEKSLSEAGVNVSNVSYKRHSRVSGPRYNGDFQNRKKYEPFQFVKLKVY